MNEKQYKHLIGLWNRISIPRYNRDHYRDPYTYHTRLSARAQIGRATKYDVQNLIEVKTYIYLEEIKTLEQYLG